MTVHYSDDWLTVLHGDVRDELRTLPDESVHCVVTSPTRSPAPVQPAWWRSPSPAARSSST